MKILYLWCALSLTIAHIFWWERNSRIFQHDSRFWSYICVWKWSLYIISTLNNKKLIEERSLLNKFVGKKAKKMIMPILTAPSFIRWRASHFQEYWHSNTMKEKHWKHFNADTLDCFLFFKDWLLGHYVFSWCVDSWNFCW